MTMCSLSLLGEIACVKLCVEFEYFFIKKFLDGEISITLLLPDGNSIYFLNENKGYNY